MTKILLAVLIAFPGPGHAAGPDLQESVVEGRERTDALNMDREARRRRSLRLANSARQAYERYVSRFDDWPQSYAVHLRYAQLLFDLDEWRAANREYRRAVEVSPHGEYAEYAAHMRMLTSNNTNDCGAFIDRKRKPVRLPACAQEQLDAFNMYLRYFGQTDEAVKARFQRGMFFQYYGRLGEAADDFTEILRTHDRDEIGQFAAARLLQVLSDSGRSRDARRWARALKTKRELMADLEVRIAMAEVLGEPKPSRPSPPAGPPPAVIAGPSNNSVFLPDDGN